MIPVAFSGLSGFVHEAPGDCAVILCGAIGYEQLCAARGWREFAEKLAAHGYPVLRFDWHGCGDSLGGDRDGGRLDAWRVSLHAAIGFARVHFGVQRIVLAGLRLGATLAAEFAAEHEIEALAMFAPAVSGRVYAREMTALAGVVGKTSNSDPNASSRRDGIEVAGFAVTSQTLDSLKGLDLRNVPPAKAKSVWLAAPAGQYGVAEYAAYLEAAGCSVEAADFPGYAEYLAEPTFSRSPDALFDSCVDFVLKAAPLRMQMQRPAPLPAAPLSTDDFSETPASFGEHPLFGVFCRPERSQNDSTALLFVNAGANPRIGWARMHVDFARRLAGEGCASLRMDIAGLGDSPPLAGRNRQIMYDQAPCADVSAGIEWLAHRGYSKIVLVGLCSGAYLAFHTAIADPRVTGIVMANLQKFVWREGDTLEVAVRNAYRSTDFYKGKALQGDTWKRMLRGDIDITGIGRALTSRLLGKAQGKLTAAANYFREGDDDTSRVRRWFTALGQRGVRVLLVYSAEDGGVDELTLHMGAGGNHLKQWPGMSLEIIEAADHNITPQWARDLLCALIQRFVGSIPAAE